MTTTVDHIAVSETEKPGVEEKISLQKELRVQVENLKEATFFDLKAIGG